MAGSNFFGATLPVSGTEFFGRRALLQTLHRSIDSHVLLIGQRRIGKTSVLRQVKLLLENEKELSLQKNRVAVLTCDAQMFAGDDHAFDSFISEIAHQLVPWVRLHTPSIAPPESSDWTSRRSVAHLIASINEAGHKALCLVDELASMKPDQSTRLRAFVQQTGLPLFGVTHRNPSFYSSDSGSAWWNFFTFNYVSLFTNDEAREMLTTLSQKSGKVFTESECSFLIDVFGRFPFYLQIAGRHIFSSSDFLQSFENRKDAFAHRLANLEFDLLPFYSATLQHLRDYEKEALLNIAWGNSVSEAIDLREMKAIGLVSANQIGQLDIFSESFKQYLNQLSTGQFQTTVTHKGEDGRHSWWDTASDVAAKALGTALEKAIEVAAGKYF